MRRPGPAVARLVRPGIVLALALLPSATFAQEPLQPTKPPQPEAPAGTPEAKPIDQIAVPQAEPPPVQPPKPDTAPLAPAVEPPPPPPNLTKDEVRDPGYLPGYRLVPSLGMSPYAPRVGGLPAASRPGSPRRCRPASGRSLERLPQRSAQFSVNQRTDPARRAEQHRLPHPASVVPDEYQSFVGTATMPGSGSR